MIEHKVTALEKGFKRILDRERKFLFMQRGSQVQKGDTVDIFVANKEKDTDRKIKVLITNVYSGKSVIEEVLLVSFDIVEIREMVTTSDLSTSDSDIIAS